MRRTASPLAVAGLLGLLLLGCGGKAPPITVWSLPVPSTGSGGVNPEGPALGVGRFTADADLRTTWLTWREGGSRQLRHYEYHEWADYPDRMVHERVVHALLGQRAWSSVTTAPPKRGLDAVLEARLVEFDEIDEASGVSVRVAVQWSLQDAEGRLLGADRLRVEKAAAKSVPAVVEAFDQAVDELATTLAARVRELAAK